MPLPPLVDIEKLFADPVRVSMNRRPMFIDAFRIEVANGETTLLRDNNGQKGATFEDAVLRHRMLAAVERAADTGIRQTPQFLTD